METLLTNGQIKVLQAYIQNELRLRCFPCTVTVTEEAGVKWNKIRLSSTKFNTIPVLHSEIEIVDFNSRVNLDKENEKYTEVYVSVQASYEGNGERLFTVSGSFVSGEDSSGFMKPRFYPSK
jgi:hypothetical protein